MALEKSDFDRIEKMFEKFEGKIQKQILLSQKDTNNEPRKEIFLDKIAELEKRVLRLEHKVGITG